MGTVTIHAAKTSLSRLIERADAGEEIIILRGKTPVARLTAFASKPVKRRFGAYRGEFDVPASFFDPLAEAELEAFEGVGCDADPLACSRAAATDDRRTTPVRNGLRGPRQRKRRGLRRT